MQAVWLRNDWYVPAPHGSHALCAVVDVNVPGLHGVAAVERGKQ